LVGKTDKWVVTGVRPFLGTRDRYPPVTNPGTYAWLYSSVLGKHEKVKEPAREPLVLSWK
jgi:hypothetical protein